MNHLLDRPRPSSVGLVFEMPLDILETDVLLTDTSGNGFTGTATNGPTLTHPGMQMTSAATDKYVQIGTGPTSVKTTSLWVFPDDAVSTYHLIAITASDRLAIATTTSVITATGFGGGTTVLYANAAVITSGVSALTVGVWQHVLITDTSGKNASAFSIGRRTTIGFNGKVADVRLYSSVLTPAEVFSLYAIQRHKFGA